MTPLKRLHWFIALLILTGGLFASPRPFIAAGALPGVNYLISVASDGTQGNRSSNNWYSNVRNADLSDDGRYVVFQSEASNLVAGDTNGVSDIFLRDRQAGTTTRISVTAGGVQADAASVTPSISADGSVIVFSSSATNLWPRDPKGFLCSLYVYNRPAASLACASLALSGGLAGSGFYDPAISSNGRYVVFRSASNDLVSGDTNGQVDVFVRDLQTGQYERVNLPAGGQANGPSYSPAISADGRYVTYNSSATNLVPGDTNNFADIFLYDRQAGTTARVSLAHDGAQPNNHSEASAISADGRWLVFTSTAENLVPNPPWICQRTGLGPDCVVSNVYVRDLLDGEIRLLTGGNGGSATISEDGRYVALSNTSDVCPGLNHSIVRVDLLTGERICISQASDGSPADHHSYAPGISASGRSIVYWSEAGNLVANDKNNASDIFLFEEQEPFAGLSIRHLEVTQGVGNITEVGPAGVPPVAGKPTFVRVYLDCGSGCTGLAGVSGVLEVTSAAQTQAIQPLNGPVTARSNPDWITQRDDLDATLNFTLPAELSQGTVTLTVRVGWATASVNIAYGPAAPLRLAFLNVRYKGIEADPGEYWKAVAYTKKLYPTNSIHYVIWPTIEWSGCFGDDCSLLEKAHKTKGLEARLTAIYNLRAFLAGDVDKPDYVYAWLPAGTYNSGHSDPAFLGGAGVAAFGDADPTEGGAVMAHEIAHLIGLRHTNTLANLSDPYCATNPAGKTPTDQAVVDEKNTGWLNQYTTPAIQEYGLDGYGFAWLGSLPAALKPSQTTYDLMSYCGRADYGNKWISPYSYRALFINRQPAGPIQAPGDLSAANSQQTRGSQQPAPQAYFLASGLVNAGGTASLDPLWQMESVQALPESPAGSQYCLEVQDATAAPLADRCFDLDLTGNEIGSQPGMAGFFQVLPAPAGAVRVALKQGALTLAERSASSHPPAVQITSPNGGESWAAGQSYTLAWSASDSDGDSLLYDVFYSPDGLNWVPVAAALTEAHLAVQSDELPGGSSARFRVLASDGFHTAWDETDAAFTVAAKKPRAYITAPQASTALPGRPVLLQGSAYDMEDGLLPEGSLMWVSDRQGSLGSGSELLVTLTPGWHQITLTATDGTGQVTMVSRRVYVGYQVYLPVARR